MNDRGWDERAEADETFVVGGEAHGAAINHRAARVADAERDRGRAAR
jgi:hypothetical protein